MEYIRPFAKSFQFPSEKRLNNYAPFVCIPDLFTSIEIDKIKALWVDEESSDGLLFGKVKNENIRRSRVQFLEPDTSGWVYDKLAMACIVTNANRYKFDISGFATKLQLAQYNEGDHFDWHMDFVKGKGSIRKLSISVQLSSSSDYTGGELEIMKPCNPMSKELGTAIIFPSYLTHRVLPVTSGKRFSIVGWVSGTPYR